MPHQSTLTTLALIAVIAISGLFIVRQSVNFSPTHQEATTLIAVGDRVTTLQEVKVRKKAGTGQTVGLQPQGSAGTTLGGPTTIQGVVWWNVNFNTGVDGWVEARFLTPAITTPTPTTEGPISSCQSLATPGTYTLTGNVTTTTSCFIITADNVILDGAGYTVTGSNAHTGVYVSGVRQGVIIKNLTIQNFAVGIALVNSRAARIEGATIRNVTYDGIGLHAANYPPVSSEISSTNTIVNTTIENAANHGIILGYGSQYNSVTGNTIRTTGKYAAIKSEGWGTNTISGNTITGAIRGIEASHTTRDLIASNTIASTTHGITLTNASSITLTQNTSCGNTTDIVCAESSGTASQNTFATQSCSFAGTPLTCPPPPDTTRPTASLTSPTQGATVSGTITLAATAADNVGVTRVDFAVDSIFFGSDQTAPYSMLYDTTQVPNGTHTITATAYDAAGNSSAPAASVSVGVSNVVAIPPGTSIDSIGTNGRLGGLQVKI